MNGSSLATADELDSLTGERSFQAETGLHAYHVVDLQRPIFFISLFRNLN
jgi:hypothetical protein